LRLQALKGQHFAGDSTFVAGVSGLGRFLPDQKTFSVTFDSLKFLQVGFIQRFFAPYFTSTLQAFKTADILCRST
jgi:hypothetical protein